MQSTLSIRVFQNVNSVCKVYLFVGVRFILSIDRKTRGPVPILLVIWTWAHELLLYMYNLFLL